MLMSMAADVNAIGDNIVGATVNTNRYANADNCFKIKLSFFRLYLAGYYRTALPSKEEVGKFEGHGSRAAVSCLHSQTGGRN